MSTRLSIGDFSKMTYLSIKSLRRYHDMGLLVPADVDRSSGYRYYEAGQVPVGQVIRRFRDLGMPLEQVKAVIEASDQSERNDIIVGHLRQMESALQQTQQTVTSLRQLLEQPRAPQPIGVEYRSVTPTGALAIHETVAFGDLEEWWVAAFEELQGALATTAMTRTGPNGALYPSELFEEEIGELTAFIPVAEAPPARDRTPTELPGRVHTTEIPGAEYALAIHEGSFGNLDQTYGALGTYVAEREIGLRGTIRENYIVTFEHTDDESAHRTEVCWPVFHTKGES
ncbi:MAG TPA: MerR family transcriptional regulator [Acidimicrobiales bacterium]|jgi:DNA-binding transcriptional MerR regulator|nr:MerR family transcriptional regulator [Acidimicrobiales bacterium]